MSKVRVHSYSISLDGFGAGVDQSLEEPLGAGGESLHEWIVATRFFHRMTGREGGSTWEGASRFSSRCLTAALDLRICLWNRWLRRPGAEAACGREAGAPVAC
jgi:hypothetical protein